MGKYYKIVKTNRIALIVIFSGLLIACIILFEKMHISEKEAIILCNDSAKLIAKEKSDQLKSYNINYQICMRKYGFDR